MGRTPTLSPAAYLQPLSANLWITESVVHRTRRRRPAARAPGTLPRMQMRITLSGDTRRGRDVLITAPCSARFGDVEPRLRDAFGAVSQLWCGLTPLLPPMPIGGSALAEGSVLSSQPTDPETTGSGTLRLDVVGGPDAGLTRLLGRGLMTIGRARASDFILHDPDVSRRHISLTVTSSGVVAHDLGATNGTWIDGVPVGGDGSLLAPGALLRIGDSLLCLGSPDEHAATIRRAPDGALVVNRGPRLLAAAPRASGAALELPQPPGIAAQPVQWLTALLPAAIGGAVAFAMHNVMFLAFAALTPLALLGTAAGDRLHWRRRRRREARTFRGRHAAALREQARLLTAEAEEARRRCPDPAALLRAATVPSYRLWERRPVDHDFLAIRLGLGDRSSTITVRRGEVIEPAGTLAHVPLTVCLRDAPLGLVGPRALVLASARWLVGQLAIAQSPLDLDLGLLLDEGSDASWRWARWLPHVRDTVKYAGQEGQALVEKLRATVDARLSHARGSGPWTGRWLVLIVDREIAGDDAGGLAELLRRGAAVGVTAICLNRDVRDLPNSCRTVAELAGETGSRVTLRCADHPDHRTAIADHVDAGWADRVARALAPLHDAEADSGTTRRESPRLLDLLGMRDMTALTLPDRWLQGGGLATVIGVGAGGPVVVDLVRDGPHALVAGTTGSGKSELLQTLVAGLAASYPPDAVSFLLVDYKGGAAFAECGRLPHTAGLVTDLDAHLTRRALRSLHAEMRRRERLLAAAGCCDIIAYRAACAPGVPALARLVIVVDEFAALADELPQFVSGLVGVAQRGRSLGVHLVLATQRPGGAVSPEIRANCALRIALRVTDPVESLDVIGSTIAAELEPRQPGHAVLRAGSTLTRLRTARITGASATESAEISVVELDAWGRVPVPPPESQPVRVSDMERLVDAADEAAQLRSRPGVGAPWRPVLPEHLSVGNLDGNRDPLQVPIALVDLPDEQAQRTLTVDLERGGAVLVVGGARCGRSGMVRTLAVQAATALGPGALHLHVIDGDGGALASLGALPHCGTVASVDGYATVDRLLHRLVREVSRRQKHLAQLRAGSLAEARLSGAAPAALLLLIDGWEAFVRAAEEFDAGAGIEMVVGLMRRAASVGMTVVIAGDRSTLASRVAGAAATKFVMRLADRADFALAGLDVRQLPVRLPPGRAVRADDGAELQFAFLGDDPGLATQCQAVQSVAARAVPAATGGPFAIRELPRQVTVADLPPADGPDLLLGVGGDDSHPLTIDPFEGCGRFLVCGPPGSGRTSALVLLLEQAVTRGWAVLAATCGRSWLADTAVRLGAAVLSEEDTDTAPLAEPHGRRRLVLIDDCTRFGESGPGRALAALLASTGPTLAVVGAAGNDEAATAYRGIAAEMRRGRRGLLLAPRPVDGDLLGIRLPRGRPVANLPGRGLLVTGHAASEDDPGSGVLPVQVARPRCA
jgi:S-DNA-T family DNA segregation ATPase FtsK/SpoIIIE